MIKKYKEIDELKRLNYITGYNKTGKTTFLKTMVNGLENVIYVGSQRNNPSYKTSKELTSEVYKWENTIQGSNVIAPVIHSGLCLNDGDVFVVENIENNLHNYSQSKVCDFLLYLLNKHNSLQIFIETQSETILNRLRIAIKENMLDVNDLKILHFTKTGIYEVAVNKDGSICDWPEGFYDQQDTDFRSLFDL